MDSLARLHLLCLFLMPGIADLTADPTYDGSSTEDPLYLDLQDVED